MKFLNIAVLLGFQLLLSQSEAALYPYYPLRAPAAAKGKELILKPRLDFSRGIDATCIQPVESLNALRAEHINSIIPAKDLQPTNDGGLVATRILDHSISNLLNSEAVRNSSLGRTAHQLEDKMEGDLSFGGSEPDSVHHSLKFSMKAAQTRADLEYNGITKALITYYIAQSATNLEIREDISLLGTELVFNHLTSPDETRRTVSFRWDW